MYRKITTKNKHLFPTYEVRAKSFSRELKSHLLDRQGNINIENFGYEKQIDTLNNLMFEARADLPFKSKEKVEPSTDFTSKSRLSAWRKGKSIPSPANQLDLENLFPYLPAKWFDRSTFNNRFQLHLATLDLKCIDSKDSTYAANDASSILNKIISDWMPKGYSNNELEISGPWERAGYQPMPYTFDYHSQILIKEDPVKGKIKYDLTLGPISYVDIKIPLEISEVYQQGNPFSIVPYMFCLLCLSEEQGNSNYKNDLFLDFLSALNCAHFFIFKHTGGMVPHGSDKVGSSVIKLFLRVSEFYYDDHWSPENQKQRHSKHLVALKKAKTEGVPPSSPFNIDLFNHPSVFLSDILQEIIYDEEQYASLQSSEKDEFQKVLANAAISLTHFRKFYVNLYKISGLTEKEVSDSLLSKFWHYSSEDGSNIRSYGPSDTSKTSPYGWKIATPNNT